MEPLGGSTRKIPGGLVMADTNAYQNLQNSREDQLAITRDQLRAIKASRLRLLPSPEDIVHEDAALQAINQPSFIEEFQSSPVNQANQADDFGILDELYDSESPDTVSTILAGGVSKEPEAQTDEAVPHNYSAKVRLRDRLAGRLRKLSPGGREKQAGEVTAEHTNKGTFRRKVGAVALAASSGLLIFGVSAEPQQPTRAVKAEGAIHSQVAAPVTEQSLADTTSTTKVVRPTVLPSIGTATSAYLEGLKAVEDATQLKPGQPGFDEAFTAAVHVAQTTLDQSH